MTIKDRIKDFRRVKSSDLKPHPQNWRVHDLAQIKTLKGILDDVGFADAILARETEDGLQIIDGHCRNDIVSDDQEIPVLVLDVTEEEARKILVSHDHITGMAGTDNQKLQQLLEDLSSNNETVDKLFSELKVKTEKFLNELSKPKPELNEHETEFIKMSFEMTLEQGEIVNEALAKSKQLNGFNDESKGELLKIICEEYLLSELPME